MLWDINMPPKLMNIKDNDNVNIESYINKLDSHPDIQLVAVGYLRHGMLVFLWFNVHQSGIFICTS